MAFDTEAEYDARCNQIRVSLTNQLGQFYFVLTIYLTYKAGEYYLKELETLEPLTEMK